MIYVQQIYIENLKKYAQNEDNKHVNIKKKYTPYKNVLKRVAYKKKTAFYSKINFSTTTMISTFFTASYWFAKYRE